MALGVSYIIDFTVLDWKKTVCVTLGILFLVQFCDYDLFENINSRVLFQSWADSDQTVEIKPGDTFQFHMEITHSPVNSIELFVEETQIDAVDVKIVRDENGEILFHGQNYTVFDDGRASKLGMIIEPERRISKGKYTVQVTNASTDIIHVYGEQDGAFNGYITQRSYIAHRMFMSVVIILILGGVFFWRVAIKKFNPPGLYLAMLIPLSMVYMVVYAPWSQPDTGSHYLASYRYSNIILGIDENLGRQEDAEFYQYVWGKDSNPSLKSYSGVVQNLHLRCAKPNLVEMSRSERMDYYSIISYLPEAIGLAIGRKLNLNTVLSIYLSRGITLLFYSLLTLYAVWRTPSGKGIMMTIGLLPMCLMMSNTISYDPMVISVSLAFIASILFLKKKPNSKLGVMEAMCWAFMLGAVKGGGYVAILPMCLMLFTKDKKSLIQLGFIISAAVISLILFDVIIPEGGLFQLGEEGNGRMAASDAFKDPLRYLNMSLESYVVSTDSLAINTGGTYLAWLEWTMPALLVMLLYIFGGVYSLYEQDDLKLNKTDTRLMLLVYLIGLIGTPAMLLSWTGIGARAIAGLQGRYYLPFVPLLMLAVTKGWRPSFIKIEDGQLGKLNKLWSGFFVVSMVSIYFILRLYLTR